MHTTCVLLLDRLRRGTDQGSWTEFVELYGPLLYRWNMAVGLQPADAQEVVQDVLLAVFQRLDRFERRHAGTFRAWLRTITLNKIRELHRRRHGASARTVAVDSLDTLPDRGAGFAWAERYAEDLFRRACDLIRPLVAETTWSMFVAAYLDHQPVEAVARRFGVSRNAVYVAQCRCLAKVRTVVGRYLDDSMQAPILDDPAVAAADRASA